LDAIKAGDLERVKVPNVNVYKKMLIMPNCDIDDCCNSEGSGESGAEKSLMWQYRKIMEKVIGDWGNVEELTVDLSWCLAASPIEDLIFDQNANERGEFKNMKSFEIEGLHTKKILGIDVGSAGVIGCNLLGTWNEEKNMWDLVLEEEADTAL